MQFAGRHDDDIWEQMQEHIPHLDQIYFAGGEPLIMDEHYYILQKLIDAGRTDVRIRYNTNLLKLHFKHYDLVEMWSKFNFVQVNASIDDKNYGAIITDEWKIVSVPTIIMFEYGKEVKRFEFSKVGTILDNIAKSTPILIEKELKERNYISTGNYLLDAALSAKLGR